MNMHFNNLCQSERKQAKNRFDICHLIKKDGMSYIDEFDLNPSLLNHSLQISISNAAL